MGRWTAPVAARTVLSLPGHGSVQGETLHLPVSQRLELEVHATDQLGRAFPQNRFRFELDFKRDCHGPVEQLHVVVGRSAQASATVDPTPVIDTREELIAASLFRGLLAREPDGDWVTAAAAQVRQGDTRAVTRSILASAEFTQRRGTAPPEELLRGLYLGLLGREPDVGALRTYSDEIRDGRYEELIDILLRSNEHQQRLARELG
jgi:hypothetical protein